MENEGEFSKLLTEDAYNLSLELVNFSNSRKSALESSLKKLDTDVDKLFNDSYVNFYTQLQGNQSQLSIYIFIQKLFLEHFNKNFYKLKRKEEK